MRTYGLRCRLNTSHVPHDGELLTAMATILANNYGTKNEGLLAPDCSNFIGNQKYCTVPKSKPTKLVTPKAYGNTTSPKGIPAPAKNFGSPLACKPVTQSGFGF